MKADRYEPRLVPGGRRLSPSAVRRAAISLGFILVCALSLSRLGTQVAALEADEQFNPLHIGAGEALLHGVAPQGPPRGRDWVAKVMPLGGLAEALLVNHCPVGARAAALGALIVLQLGLIYALTAVLSGPLEGLAASLCYAWSGRGDYTAHGSVQFFYALLVSVAALALARLAKRPSMRNHLAAGLAIGCTLLGRSPLAFLPPVLAFIELARARSRGKPPKWRRLAALVFVPYLFLVPWTAMNWSLQGKFIPFEYQEADRKIIGAVIGQSYTGEPFSLDMIENPPDDSKTGAVLWWAVARIVEDPIRYLTGYAARLRLVLRWHGLPLILALLAGWRFRRDPAFRGVAILGLYFLLVYCTITVHRTYFQPLIPIAAALAAAGLGRAVRPRPEEGRAPSLWYQAGLGSAIALSALALLRVSVYAFAGERPDESLALESAVSRNPRDPWLASRNGRHLLSAGRPEAARDEFARAVELSPRDRLRRFESAAAAYRLGDPSEVLGLEDREDGEGQLELDLLKVMAWRSVGRGDLAARRWNEVMSREGQRERVLATAASIVSRYAPAHEREAEARSLERFIVSGRGENARRLLDQAVLRHLAGRNAAAADDLERALELDPALQPAYVTLGAVYTALGRHADAARTYRRGIVRTAGGNAWFLGLMRDSERESAARGAKPFRP